MELLIGYFWKEMWSKPYGPCMEKHLLPTVQSRSHCGWLFLFCFCFLQKLQTSDPIILRSVGGQNHLSRKISKDSRSRCDVRRVRKRWEAELSFKAIPQPLGLQRSMMGIMNHWPVPGVAAPPPRIAIILAFCVICCDCAAWVIVNFFVFNLLLLLCFEGFAPPRPARMVCAALPHSGWLGTDSLCWGSADRRPESVTVQSRQPVRLRGPFHKPIHTNGISFIKLGCINWGRHSLFMFFDVVLSLLSFNKVIYFYLMLLWFGFLRNVISWSRLFDRFDFLWLG